MQYSRPRMDQRLETEAKTLLLESYFEFCEQAYKKAPGSLNQKIPRDVFSNLLNEIGCLLVQRSKEMIVDDAVKQHLDATPLPPEVDDLLPSDFRVFCLALNALKQWVSAEQSATDRYLLGSTGRQRCKDVATHCLVTGEQLDASTLELHHPVRDGRPPIPLSKEGHELVERQHSEIGDESDFVRVALAQLKKEGNRSWVMLRRGCLLLLDQSVPASPPSVTASSKTFARKAAKQTKLNYAELVEWLDQNSLGKFK